MPPVLFMESIVSMIRPDLFRTENNEGLEETAIMKYYKKQGIKQAKAFLGQRFMQRWGIVSPKNVNLNLC